MTNEEIREIINILKETGVADLEVQRGENRVRIRRDAPPAAELMYAAPSPAAAIQAPAPAAPVAPPPASKPVDEKLPVVTAPIVGTFYESPSPGAPVFVKPGDTVQPGQVICIIESMKLMNEIEAECAGVIVAKLVSNGKPVEYGEALYTYRPL